MEKLRKIVSRIDGRGYKAYKDIRGRYDLTPHLAFIVDHVQGDPFASPSKVRLRLSMGEAGIPKDLYATKNRKVALQDFILRLFDKELSRFSRKRGTGGSGTFRAFPGGQEIIERSGCVVTDDFVEVRFLMGFPADGRRIKGRVFLEMVEELIKASKALRYKNMPREELIGFIQTYEDQELIREKLKEMGLAAFVADGSILPRRSGIDDRPMKGAVPFRSPETLKVSIETDYNGLITGMGIPEGVTLIVGGGFHGKTTLLEAIQFGVYNHIPGDGREWAITVKGAVKVRSEDGRFVRGVDISPFIGELPMGKDTRFFSTDDASGSTSIAANIMEALEMGAELLLIDEDTSATNFLIRDARMQRLVSKDKEPITPFIDRVRQLYKELGVSTIMVIGGSGDYLDVADTVIAMDSYVPKDVTAEAKKVAKEIPTGRIEEGKGGFGSLVERVFHPESFEPKGRKKKIKSKGIKEIVFGKEVVDVSDVEQIVEEEQLRCITEIIGYFKRHTPKEGLGFREGIEKLLRRISDKGFDILTPYPYPDLSLPRSFEVAAAINRMSSLVVHQRKIPLEVLKESG